MPPHNQPHLIIDNTHRVMVTPPVDYDRRPQVEEQRLWTTDELLWCCFFTGLASVLFTCGMAWWLS